MSQDTAFPPREIIKFDQPVINVGGGYIDDNNSTDYGKFIAPQNGTYQFNAHVYNINTTIGADLRKNGALITAAKNGGVGSATLSAILDLVEGDEVYLVRPEWVGDEARFNLFFTSFSGVLIRADF